PLPALRTPEHREEDRPINAQPRKYVPEIGMQTHRKWLCPASSANSRTTRPPEIRRSGLPRVVRVVVAQKLECVNGNAGRRPTQAEEEDSGRQRQSIRGEADDGPPQSRRTQRHKPTMKAQTGRRLFWRQRYGLGWVPSPSDGQSTMRYLRSDKDQKFSAGAAKRFPTWS